MRKFAVVFRQDASPEMLDTLAAFIKTQGTSRYVLADEFTAGYPLCTLSLKGEEIQLEADVQSHDIALVVASKRLKQMGLSG